MKLKIFGISFLFVGILAGLFVYDRLNTRPHRLKAAECHDNMVRLSDAIVRYEYEKNKPLKKLNDLIPAYASRSMIYCRLCWIDEETIRLTSSLKYRYNPETRTISDPGPHAEHGFLNRDLALVTLKLGDFTPRKPLVALKTLPEKSKVKTITVKTSSKTTVFKTPAKTLVKHPPPKTKSIDIVKIKPVQTDPIKPIQIKLAGLKTPSKQLAVKIRLNDVIVLEAENFSAMNYGWEIRDDSSAGGGRQLISKEGTCNSTGTKRHFGDYYNVGNVKSREEIYYVFSIPKTGYWYFSGRLNVTGTHCSNAVHTYIDGKRQGELDGHNFKLFRWFWSNPHRIYFKKGKHTLRLFQHEDGLSIDQLLFSKKRLKLRNETTLEAGDEKLSKGKQACTLVHDFDKAVLTPGKPPKLKVWLRRTGKISGKAHLKTVMEIPGKALVLLDKKFDIGNSDALIKFPLDLSKLDIKKLPRREYLVKSTLTIEGKVICSKTHVFMKPFVWRISKMFPHTSTYKSYPFDGWLKKDKLEYNGTSYPMQDLKDEWHDSFGVMDFGLMFAKNSLFAPELKSVVAQTKFKVDKAGTYLFKVLGDDQMLLWLDGKLIARQDEILPVTRSGQRVKVKLSQGEHRLQFRLNQRRDRWQAAVFIRTEDDQVSNVQGLEWVKKKK